MSSPDMPPPPPPPPPQIPALSTLQRAIVDIAASPIPLLEKLDQLDDLTPPLFIDLSTAWTTRLTEKCRLHASDLNAALAAVSTLTASLIDRGIVADEVFPGSQLASAMATKNSKRDAFLRVLTQARKETASRAPGRMTDLMACRDAVAQLTVQSSGAADACRAQLDELDEELGILATWEKNALRFVETLDTIVSEGMSEPDTAPLYAFERDRSSCKEKFKIISRRREDGEEVEPSAVEEARAALSASERHYQDERLRIARVAEANFPHLFLLHPILRLTDADLGEDGLFVEGRHLDHFHDVRILPAESRHTVRTGSMGGKMYVLKEYNNVVENNGINKEWRRMRREARLLRRLGEHPNIAQIDHVFIHPPLEGRRLAYLQMPYYEGGNLEDWIAIHKPDVSFMQSIFVQVAQALAFTHNNGVVHADVKLPNVLMDGDGVPHLCDFEFSQAQTFTQSTVAGFGTLEYVAPEVRQLKPGEKLQPSSDMFSFGICLLLAFCTPEQYHRTPAGHLSKLQHPDQNLVELIGSLLQVDPDTRPSAIEASRSAFLDPVRLFERANEQIGAAKEEEARVETDAREKSRAIEKQRERAVRDAQAKTRQMRQQEADVRKKLQDEEIAANDRIREAQKSVDRDRRAAAKKQKELAKEQRDLEKKEKDVNVEKSSLEEERGRVATLQKEALKVAEKAEKAVTKMKKEKADLDKIKAAKIQVPAYWTDKDSKSTGFKMQPVDFGTQSLLEQAMNTSAWSDDTSGVSPYDATPYTHLGVAKAWRCENHALWKRYVGAKDLVRAEVNTLRNKNKVSSPPIPMAMRRNAELLPASLDSCVNEVYAVHGSKPDVLPKVLNAGTNHHFTERAVFGYGTYFGDDAHTSDGYAKGLDVAPDLPTDCSGNSRNRGDHSNLHELIYTGHASHPNRGRDQSDKGIHYMLICRLVMGKTATIQGTAAHPKSMNTDGELCFVQRWSGDERDLGELGAVKGSNPPIHYHSLFASKPSGGRGKSGQKELITFHDDRVYPEYLVAYYRTNKTVKPAWYRANRLKDRTIPRPNMQCREDVQFIIAHAMIWEGNCAVAGGFVRDYIINNEPSNDVDVLLMNGIDVGRAKGILDGIKEKWGGIRGIRVAVKGSTNCATVRSSSNSWVPIEVDLSDPTKLGKLSPPPGIDTDAGNLVFTRKGIELKIDKRGLPRVTEVIERIKRKEFLYLQNFDDKTKYGRETGGGKCQRRLEKYLERGWTCLTRVPDSVMNMERFKRFKPLVKPDRKFEKEYEEWWKL